MTAKGQERDEVLWRGLRELYRGLSSRRRRQFYAVLALMVAGAFAELATIGAVLPFLSLLARLDSAERLPALAGVFESIGTTTSRQLAIATTAFVIVAFIAGAIRLQLTWSSQKFTFGVGHDLAVDVQRRVLLQPYSYHVAHNTSSLVASLEEVPVLAGVLQQVMQAGTSAFIATFIVAALIYVDPFSAFVAAAGFSLVYALVPAVTRRRLQENSATIGPSYDERVKIVQESLGGIRDILIDGSQSVFVDAFRRVDERFSDARASTAFISAAPRFAIEALGMVLIAIIAVAISTREGGFASALPILGALALGAQRLLPLLQQMYLGWTQASGHKSVLRHALELLRLRAEIVPTAEHVGALPFHEQIAVEQVSFIYPNRRTPAIDNVTFAIPFGCSVALVGKTGSGKSTLADLLMGLLDPSQGGIMIDGVPLTGENRRAWQRSIAHVPQSIFLADSSIARNIAFGVPADRIEVDRVTAAAKTAQLHDFISALPEAYDTLVGERGIRLSGGQRQRLGIARALYKQAPVLVLDEATSALDDSTEAAVLQALDAGEDHRTIIIIAHRLSTISRADLVVRLDSGRVVELSAAPEAIRPARRR